jgi:hypothetical protein
MVVWPSRDAMLLGALHELGFKAPAIRKRLGDRYTIHQVRYQLREQRRPWPEQWAKVRKLGWRYVIPEGPPELWKRLNEISKRIDAERGLDG